VSSLLNKEQQRSIAEQVKKGRINILFMTPEALQTDFLYHLEDFPEANFVCVDEAHSLSELSHNFRTSFLTLGDIILHMVRYKTRRPTILGLTATANPDTVRSVIQKLEIAEVVRSSSCMNKNLFVTISRERGQLKYESLIRYLNDPLVCECRGILVYCRTRRIMEEVFNYISNSVAAKAAIYHSALSSKQKT
jgi:superfamily II DNA helicase RecQ